ncbi:hypothetical protein KA183_07405 [bacterium]|nr:hypothetical protein [bacterium]QQR58289.1 MAG: hypothetical protein IPG59_02000 [Candidatus Melainabacteria bacterium]
MKSARAAIALAYFFSLSIAISASNACFAKDSGWIESDQSKFNAEQKAKQDAIKHEDLERQLQYQEHLKQQQQLHPPAIYRPNYSPYFGQYAKPQVHPNQQARQHQLQQHPQPPVQHMQFNQEIEAQSQVKHHSKNFAHKALAAPKSVAGAIAGVTIGVPVHVTKSISEHSKSMKRSMNEGLDVDEREIDLAGRGMSAMCAYPYGFFSGMIHGTIKGVGRGISSGSKKPFSKESFSIGESTPSQTSPR